MARRISTWTLAATAVILSAVPAGAATIVVTTTIRITGGVLDGKGNTYTSKGLNCFSEGCPRPIFRVENGATLKNLTIGSGTTSGDAMNAGVWMYNGATLENVTWTRVGGGSGVHAATVKASASLAQQFRILGGSASTSTDQATFQVNAASTVVIDNFTATDFITFLRQNGGTTYRCNLNVTGSRLRNGTYGIRTDSSSTVINTTGTTFTNVKIPVKKP